MDQDEYEKYLQSSLQTVTQLMKELGIQMPDLEGLNNMSDDEL